MAVDSRFLVRQCLLVATVLLSLAGGVEAFTMGVYTVPSPLDSPFTTMLKAVPREELDYSRRETLTSLAVLAAAAPRVANAAASNQTDAKSSGGSDAKNTAQKTSTSLSATSSTLSKSTATTSKPSPSSPKLENPGNVKNCSDFKDYKEAKAWYEKYFSLYGDVARLDGDKDGIPCESLPGAPSKTKAKK